MTNFELFLKSDSILFSRIPIQLTSWMGAFCSRHVKNRTSVPTNPPLPTVFPVLTAELWRKSWMGAFSCSRSMYCNIDFVTSVTFVTSPVPDFFFNLLGEGAWEMIE